MDNALIIDLVLAAVLAVFALLGARKGLIRSLMALVSVVVALIGATLLTAMFVEPVTDLVYPKVEERVLEQFERDIPSDALAAEDGDLSAGGLLPDELSEALGEALDTLKPVLAQLNGLGGAALSLIEGALLIFLIVFLAPRLGVTWFADHAAGTHLLAWFLNNTPRSIIASLT